MYVLCSDVLNKSMFVILLNFWYLEHGFLDVLDKFGNPSYFFFMYFTFNHPLSSDQPTTIKNTYVCHSFFLDMFLIRRFSLQLPCALTYWLPMETPVSYIQREEPGYRCTVNLASNCWALRTSGVAWMVPTSLVYLPVQVKHKTNPISQSLINPFNWEVHGKASDFSWL